jgi:hypothetical protein
MHRTKTIEWHASTSLEGLVPLFLKQINLNDKKHLCVFPNALVKSTLFFYGCKQMQSFGLFQTFYLDEFLLFLKATYQKESEKKLFSYRELVLFLEAFLEQNHIFLQDHKTPLTLKKQLYPKMIDQLAKELFESICNPTSDPLLPKKEKIKQQLLESAQFLNPFDVEFEGEDKLHIHLFGFCSFELVQLEFFFRLDQNITLYSFYPTFVYLNDEIKNPLLFSNNGFLKKQQNLMETFGIDMITHFQIPSNLSTGLPSNFVDFEITSQTAPAFLKKLQLDIITDQKTELVPDASVQLFEADSSFSEVQNLITQIKLFLRKEGNEPQDVLVLVKDLELLAPLIQSTFKNPELPFDGQFLKKANQNPFVCLVFKYLDLFEKGFEKQHLFELLFQKPIYTQFQLNPDHLAIIEKKCKMTFGFSAQHQKECFEQDGISNPKGFKKFTFEGFKELWLEALVEGRENLFDPALDTFGKCIELIEKWYEELKCVRIDEKRALGLWVDFIFSVLDNFYIDFEEMEMQFGKEQLIKKLTHFSHYDYVLSFSNFRYQLEQALTTATSHYYEGKNSILFCSFEMENVLPRKMIALLGMHLDSSANAQTSAQKRHTFLKAVSFCQDYFMASFSKKNAMQEEHQMAFFLQELQWHYNVAIQRVEQATLLPVNSPSCMQIVPSKPCNYNLTFQELFFVLSNPIKAYCQKRLNFYLPKEEKAFDLFLDNKKKFKLLKEDLSVEQKIHFEELPVGLLEKVALFDVQQESSHLKEQLDRFGIEQDTIFSIAIEKKAFCFEKNKIFGLLNNLTPKGALIFSKQKQSAHLKALITLIACQEKIAHKAILCDFDQIIEAHLEKEALGALNDLALYFLDHPTPFFPEMIGSILKNETGGVKHFFDPYLIYFPHLELTKAQLELIKATFEPFVKKGFFSP